MPIVLSRVDERLIHGQVVLGWGSQLRPDRYLVVDDELAASEWEQDLYRLGVPNGVACEFHSSEDGRRLLGEWQGDPRRSVLLVRDLAHMVDLERSGRLSGDTVILGGIHPGTDRRELLPFLFLSRQDLERIQWLDAHGVVVVARELPATPAVGAAALLRRGRALWKS